MAGISIKAREAHLKFHASVFAAAVAALLSACGGGSSDNASAAPTTGAQSVAITSVNQTSVARATVNAAFSLGLVQNESPSGGTSAAASSGATSRMIQRVLDKAVAQRRGIATASAHPAAITSSTAPCDISGSIATSVNDADNSGQLSAGDVITATFQQCEDSTALTINGTLTITLTGTPASTQFAGNAVFQNVVASYTGVTYTINGNTAISETDTDTLSSSTFTVGAAGLTVATAATGYADSITFDAGLVAASSFIAGTNTLTLTGSFVSQSIGGRVTIATPHGLVQQAADAYPSQGQLLITGASGSTLLVTALNSTQVQLQVDANGDGTVDSTTTATWASLIP
jgi:hypothetical protein